VIALCKCGAESRLSAEGAAAGMAVSSSGPMHVRLDPGSCRGRDLEELCFAHSVLLDDVEVTAPSGRAMVSTLCDHFCASAKTERFSRPWPLLAWEATGEGAPLRLLRLEGLLVADVKVRMARVARLAGHDEPPHPCRERGLFVFRDAPGHAFVARDRVFLGQRRMRDDPGAPSRSYLKVEEAYAILGVEPQAGERVADLGAAPGGWSYSAARRGARVVAVDNGAMKGAAAEHPEVEHLTADGFVFRPDRGKRFGWLFCDMVEDPHRVLALVEKWVSSAWCEKFIVNLKMGRAEAVPMVSTLKPPDHPLRRMCRTLVCRELYHDRDEVTLMGVVKQ
jgi:23S rRNA (cytidine2498-2'-O)-methyltransferase